MDTLRQALRRLAKAVVVITSAQDNVRYAMSATAVSEVSMEPPSMLICVNRKASLYPVLAGGAPFALNILHHSHADIASRCAGEVRGEARFEIGRWSDLPSGVPILADAQAAIACRNNRQIDYGTHGIFIGDVLEVALSGSPSPLVYVDGRFSRIADEPVGVCVP